MANNNNLIPIPGRMHCVATEGVGLGADEIFDDAKGKRQSVINQETDTALDNKYDKDETYSKQELNNLITTPNQDYVTVPTYASLPATGEADTVYRVSNYDGEQSQVDATKYSEYAWDGTQYVFLCVKSQIGEVFDITAYNSNTKYADLSAALSGTNVPTSVRKGGMSVKYVQSFDNKYVQARCMAQNFTTDTDDWAVCSDSVLIDNPEFIDVKTDKDGKILWAIKIDGSIYWGTGVPQQVIDYINERIAELSLDEYEDIVAFLNGLEEGDKTLQTLLNEKVDKEDGKSLIDSEYASTKSTIDNPEFLEVTTDSEDKVLEGIQQDGTKVIGGDFKVLGNMEVSGVSYRVIENPEYIAAWVDSEDKVIFGLKGNGKTYVGDAYFFDDIKNNQEAINEIKSYLTNFDSLDIDALSSITAVENPELIEAKTDSEGKLLAGRTPDGTAFENVGFTTPKVSIDGHTTENIEDPEGRTEILTDSKGKVISYRSSDGVKHEEVGIETPYLKVNEIDSPNLQKMEFTDIDDTIYVERPKFGEIWFEGNLPTDTSDARTPTWLIMTFKNSGVFQFKCRCTLALQGHGSLAYAKKGYTLEPYNEKEEAISIKFGDMIAIDSFHLKAYATDSLHCRDMANFNIWRDMIKSLEYPFSKFNNIPFSFEEYNKNTIDTADAKYAPDGFPVVCYLNGNFLGLYTIKLKKSRQNYAMEKSIKSEIFMDAISSASNLYHGFNHSGWDLKNPKIKNYEEGGEITDATVLANINRFFNWVQQIDKNTPSTYENYSDYMALPHWIVYLIFEELIASYDTGSNNIQLATWDATHWSIIPYDTDITVGLHPWDNIYPTGQPYTILTGLDCFVFTRQTDNIFPVFEEIFIDEIRDMWTTLRKSGMITPSNIVQYYIDQCKAIPRDVYSKDYKKWGNIWHNGVPSIEQLYVFINNRINWLDQQWLNN